MNNQFYLADAIDVIEEVLASGGEFRIYPRGTSMLPLIVQERDSVVLKRCFTVPAKRHDIAFYRRKNGQFVLHRVMKICKDGTYVMCGDNQTELEVGIEPSQIIAYTAKIYRKDKQVNLDGAGYTAYVFFWTKMPIRKMCRFTKRVCLKLLRIFRAVFRKEA